MEFYRGDLSVAFTLCVKGVVAEHMNLRDPEIVSIFTTILVSVAAGGNCIVPVYCFMSDHQHVIITGTQTSSDLWKTIVRYKQKTGFWLSKNRPEMKWQKDFYDHIIRTDENIAVQAKYILDNPVRKGIALSWDEYPFKGSIGCRLEDVLTEIV